MALRLLARSKVSNARLGLLTTKDGVLETPAFVAVGTNAALKSVDLRDVPDIDALFVNAYHLMLHPGVDVIHRAGGVRNFMATEKVVMSDSGGFQVFSLKYGTVHSELSPSLKMRSGRKIRKDGVSSEVKVRESGVTFRSYRDGSHLHLSPEVSVSAQKKINSSIIMPLDELPPYHTTPDVLRTSLERTHRWMARSLDTHLGAPQGQLCYGIVHGGSVPALRKESVDFCVSHGFDGFAIGGALGKDADELSSIVRFVMDDAENGEGCGLRDVAVRTGRPVHALGIADPWNIRRLVRFGVDTFDGCFVTKISRHGAMLTGDPRNPTRLSVKSGRWKDTHERLDCECSTCTQYTLSYLHHLIKAREPLADALLSIHNLTFVGRVMKTIREDIRQGEL